MPLPWLTWRLFWLLTLASNVLNGSVVCLVHTCIHCVCIPSHPPLQPSTLTSWMASPTHSPSPRWQRPSSTSRVSPPPGMTTTLTSRPSSRGASSFTSIKGWTSKQASARSHPEHPRLRYACSYQWNTPMYQTDLHSLCARLQVKTLYIHLYVF